MKENELIENEKKGIESEEETKESDIRVLEDFAPVITNIVIEPQVFKSFTSYIAKITVKSVGNITVRVDESLVNYVKTCQKLNKQPFTSKLVVKEENVVKQKTYVCLKFTTAKGNVYRYFINRADIETLELVLDDYNLKLKK